jgi:hypothetical protein
MEIHFNIAIVNKTPPFSFVLVKNRASTFLSKDSGLICKENLLTLFVNIYTIELKG